MSEASGPSPRVPARPRRRAALADRRSGRGRGWRQAVRRWTFGRLVLTVLALVAVVMVVVAAVALVISLSAGPSLPVQVGGAGVGRPGRADALAYAGRQVTATLVAITVPNHTVTVAPEGQLPITAVVTRASQVLITGRPTRLDALLPGDEVVVRFAPDSRLLTVRRLNDIISLPLPSPTPCQYLCAPPPTPIPSVTPTPRASGRPTPRSPGPTAPPTPAPPTPTPPPTPPIAGRR